MEDTGIILCKPTGRVLDEDNQYVEVTDKDGLTRYARPCYTFPMTFAPSEGWLDKYKDEIMICCMYEEESDSDLFWLGWTPLDGKLTEVNKFPKSGNIRTEKFFIEINDEDDELRIAHRLSGTNVTREIVIKTNNVYIKNTIINLGSENAAEPAVLGLKNEIVLNAICDAIIIFADGGILFCTAQETVATLIPLFLPLVPGWVAFKAVFVALKAAMVSVKALIPATKSNVVKLD